MTEQRFCQFCGQFVDTPCVDETDLSVYRIIIERCSDAAIAFEYETSNEQCPPNQLRKAIKDCPVCGTDCAGANPPVYNCPVQCSHIWARQDENGRPYCAECGTSWELIEQ